MDDAGIIELYLARSQDAIVETDRKYGRLCRHIAMNILHNDEDSEECVNDTYFGVWNAIPPQMPSKLSAFISKIARNLALKKYDYITAAKRNPEASSSLSELEECVSGRQSVEDIAENKRIEKAIGDFLWLQSVEKRTVFIRRYWYFDSIDDIAEHCGFTRSKVASMLHNTRRKLREYMEKEDIDI